MSYRHILNLIAGVVVWAFGLAVWGSIVISYEFHNMGAAWLVFVLPGIVWTLVMLEITERNTNGNSEHR